LLLSPALCAATNTTPGESGNGTAASSSPASSASQSVTTSTDTATVDTSTGNSASENQSQNENRVQTQTNNPGVGTLTQEQTEAKITEQIKESKPTYSPRNEQASARMSTVATAVEQLIRVSNQVGNQGIGDQIREIAQTQTKNQDKINQSVDKAETRTGFAKFFIGENYKELKAAKQSIKENKEKLGELKSLMEQVETDADKLIIPNN